MSDPFDRDLVDDGWIPDDASILRTVHPSAIGVSGMMLRGRREPIVHRFDPWWWGRMSERDPWRSRLGNLSRPLCRRCSRDWRGHRRANREDRAELRRRAGKVERQCPRCLGTRDYVDPEGVFAFRECPRCEGWGRVWEEPTQ